MREVLVLSDRPVDVVDQLGAGASDGRDLGIRTLWNRGATQLVAADGRELVTVMRSTRVDDTTDLERWDPRVAGVAPAYLTELFVADDETARAVEATIVCFVGGHVLEGER